jgi:hypothetical protein
MRRLSLLWSVLLASVAFGAQAQATDKLPDITIWRDKLNDNSIDTTTMPGHVLLRLSTGTPNLGPGRLELRGGSVISTTRQQVNQRVYRTDNTFYERPAGEFTYHPSHSHIHFDRWCVYRLRRITTDGGVGEIISTGQKTSFCILDLTVHNSSNPNYRSPGFYSGCGTTVQGLTPGWADIYSRGLTDQWVDVTGVPDGEYWLEAEVDPDNFILEGDETNNVDRVRVRLGTGQNTSLDAYEPNNSMTEVEGRPSGGTNSPNLGTVNALKVINDLSLHVPTDKDYFRFRLNKTGTVGNSIKIEPTEASNGDADLKLYNSQGVLVGSSESSTNTEVISLNGKPAGVYFAYVYSYSGTLPKYRLTISPNRNDSPTISISTPAQDVWVELGVETFPVQWTASDPNNDPMTVALFRCPDLTTGKTQGMIGGYEALNSTDGIANVNTAEMPLGRWFLYARVTDGASQMGQYAPGSFTIYRKADLDWNNIVDKSDWALYAELTKGSKTIKLVRPEWRHLLDMDRNGVVDSRDLALFKQATLQ